ARRPGRRRGGLRQGGPAGLAEKAGQVAGIFFDGAGAALAVFQPGAVQLDGLVCFHWMPSFRLQHRTVMALLCREMPAFDTGAGLRPLAGGAAAWYSMDIQRNAPAAQQEEPPMTEREKSYAEMLYQLADPELAADRDVTVQKLYEY